MAKTKMNFLKNSLSIILILSGLMSIILTFRLALNANSIWQIFGFLIIGVYFGGLILGGFLLLLGKKQWGYLLSLIILIIQLPFFMISHFSYQVASFPFCEIMIWPDIGFQWADSAKIGILFLREPQPFYFGINFLAGVLIFGLIALYQPKLAFIDEKEPADVDT
jgi:hypothetical protein